MREEVIMTKVANALIEEVKVNVATPMTSVFSAAFDGLWVGGRVTLTTTTVSFSANGLNRMVQSGRLRIRQRRFTRVARAVAQLNRWSTEPPG
jgi:hypothetical protein